MGDNTTTIQRKGEHLLKYSWKPGQSGNPTGRPKGSRSKLAEDFVSALYDDFQLHGVNAIQQVREDKPEVYIQTIAKLLPRDVKVEVKELTRIAHVIIDANNNKELQASQTIEIAPATTQAIESNSVIENQPLPPPMKRIVE